MRALFISSRPSGALRRALVAAGFDVSDAASGRAGLARLPADAPDVVLVSGELPDMDCLWVCRMLRAKGGPPPILVLASPDGTPDAVAVLNAGADDYLPHGAAPGELLARLRALVRRSSNGSNHTVLRFADLELDATEFAARRGDRVVRLTRTEFELLRLFMLNPRRVLAHELIYERVWGYDFALSGNALRVYVGYLRRKLEAGGEPRLLHTVRGVGYVLRVASAVHPAPRPEPVDRPPAARDRLRGYAPQTSQTIPRLGGHTSQ